MAAIEILKKRKSNSYKNCPRVILNVVPSDCEKITFSDLVPGADYQNKALVGKINHLYPLGKRVDGETRKILITDALAESESSERKLPVFLFDQYAKDSETCEVESYIILTNFVVQDAPNKKTADLPVQVLVKRNESQVWFGRKVIKGAKKKSKNPNQSKKKKTSEIEESRNQSRSQRVSDDEESHAISAHEYEYTKLGDLIERDAFYNVYGVVDKCDLKITSGKRKQILELLLTDQTEASFSCTVFAADGETFPDVYPGDVMRIHRMQVCKFRNKLKGRCPNSKFILVFSKHNDGEKPRTVAKTFTFTPEDAIQASELLQWNKIKNDPKLICDIIVGNFVNIICQVIGVYVAKTEAVILKIWDGTKTTEFPGVHLGLKEEKLDQRLFTIARDYYVNLFVYGHHIAAAAELEPGKFIEVRDAHLNRNNNYPDETKLNLHAGNNDVRGIFVLNENDDRVIELKERLEKIITDTLEFGNQTEDLLSQNNSIFLNYDISVFNSQKANDEIAEQEDALNAGSSAAPEKERDEQNRNGESDESGRKNNTSVNTDVDLLNQPLSRDNAAHEKTVVSTVDVSIKPGQSTQEFGLGMQRAETSIPDDENRMSVASEPDPVCNLTPLQTRHFFHNPQRSSNQMTDSIFPTYTNASQEDWWNSVPTVSVTDQHSNIKPNTLAEVVKHGVPFKFRVLAAVLYFKPNTNSIHKFIHLYCPNCPYISEEAIPLFEPFGTRHGLPYYICPDCNNKEAVEEHLPLLEYTFLISLSLHDGSGPPCVEAYLWKENAVKFFKGITPEEALKDSATADSILHMLWSICPNCRPFNSSNFEHSSAYPVLDCCILSYVAENETRFQMFDTILL